MFLTQYKMEWKKAIPGHGSWVCNNSSHYFFGIMFLSYRFVHEMVELLHHNFFKPSPNIKYSVCIK